jgi:hypothetical protein
MNILDELDKIPGAAAYAKAEHDEDMASAAHWQDVRERAAIAALVQIYALGSEDQPYISVSEAAYDAVNLADAVVAALNGGQP